MLHLLEWTPKPSHSLSLSLNLAGVQSRLDARNRQTHLSAGPGMAGLDNSLLGIRLQERHTPLKELGLRWPKQEIAQMPRRGSAPPRLKLIRLWLFWF